MKKNILILIGIFIVIAFSVLKFYYRSGRGDIKYSNITIGNVNVIAELADNPQKQYRGLSGRESLENGKGMLFIFKNYGKYPFVMRDMKFSIDIIWIRDNAVVDVSENLPLPVFGNLLIEYSPSSNINKVLEVPAEFVKANNIKIGDNLEIADRKT